LVVLKGIVCPKCREEGRTVIETVRRPTPGLVVRYRVCKKCLTRIVTEERVAKERKTAPRKTPLKPRKEFPEVVPAR
jgi:transcriptional regulator NrdR family protein